jgi:hypothetical protein
VARIVAEIPLPDGIEPLAVWDANDPDGLYCRHLVDAAIWSNEHLPDGGWNVHTVEFYVMDIPFALCYGFRRDDDGKLYVDPETGRLEQTGPVTLLLDELPPRHLLEW